MKLIIFNNQHKILDLYNNNLIFIDRNKNYIAISNYDFDKLFKTDERNIIYKENVTKLEILELVTETNKETIDFLQRKLKRNKIN